jgi:hypothetical protein
MASPDGQHPGCGRKPRDTIRVACSLPRPVYEELVRRERETGTYRCSIAAEILSEALISDIANRELSVSRLHLL